MKKIFVLALCLISICGACLLLSIIPGTPDYKKTISGQHFEIDAGVTKSASQGQGASQDQAIVDTPDTCDEPYDSVLYYDPVLYKVIPTQYERGATYVESIGSSLPLMQFDVDEYSYFDNWSDNTYYYATITISWFETGEVLQEINEVHDLHIIGHTQHISTRRMSSENLIIEDINFDGYKDIRLPFALMQVHVYYYCWIFDNETGQFVFRPDLYIPNLKIDRDNHTIRASWRNGYSDFVYYEFADNALIPMEKESLGIPVRDENGNLVNCDITYEMIEGEWVEVSRLPTRAFG